MPRRLVPIVDRFNRVVSVDVPANAMILQARPERSTLILSTELFVGTPTYVLGRSVSDGLIFRLTTGDSAIKLCASDLGDVVGLPLWNGGGALLRARVSESWEVPTGKCVCE